MKNKILLFIPFLCLLIIPFKHAQAASSIGHSLGSFYAGQDIEAIDMDGDGDIDIVGSAYASGGGLYWFENDGSATFTKHNIHTSSSYDYMHLDAGDIDGDTDIDVVVSDRNGYVFLYTNDGSESFTRATVASGLYDPQHLRMGDLDDDGDIDILVPNGAYTSTWVGNVRWYENNGSESFTARYVDSDQPDAFAGDYGDMDGDTDTDIIAMGNTWGNVSKYMSNGGTPPTFTETYVGSGSQGLEIIDLDKDTDLDFVTVGWYYLRWYENNGSASFTTHTISSSIGNGTNVYVDDIDSDGDYDLLVPESSGGVSWWENDGSYNFTKSAVTTYSSSTTTFGAIADIDGGGDKEIICFGSSNTLYWYEIVMDSTPPSISTLSPADDATNVATTSNLVITFDEAVNAVSGNVTLYKSDDTQIEQFDVTTDISGSGGTTITINPTADLDEQTSYYVQIDATAFDDTSGNSYAGITDTTSWTFTTADETNPTVSTLSPADDSTGISTTANLVITFDEAVDAVSGNVTLYKSDNTQIEQFDVTTDITGSGGTTITINPTADLDEQTSYYVQIDATAFDDTSGNSYAGITDTTSWTFTTADETNPAVSTLSPADDATDISTTSNLVITFDEAVDAVSGNVTLYKSDDTQIEQFDVTIDITGSGGTTITINPTADLDEQTSYYVQIDATAFDDASGNSYAGIADETTWTFTTADETNPTVSTLTPADDATAIEINANLIIVFDEAVDVETGNITIKSGGSTVETIDVTSSAVTGTGTTTITIDPVSNFAYETSYNVEIAATAFDDASSNSYAGIADATTWNFTTKTDPSAGGLLPLYNPSRSSNTNTETPVQDEDESDSTTESESVENEQESSSSEQTEAAVVSAEQPTFPDVSFSHQDSEAIETLSKMEIISGYPDGEFKPEAQINRAEFVKISVLMSGVVPSGLVYNNCFADVTDDWYAPYVCYAKKQGWIDGYEDGLFRPEQPITRAELFKIVMNSKGIDTSNVTYSDIDLPEDGWYTSFIAKAYDMGIVGQDSESLEPDALVERALACKYICEILELLQ